MSDLFVRQWLRSPANIAVANAADLVVGCDQTRAGTRWNAIAMLPRGSMATAFQRCVQVCNCHASAANGVLYSERYP